jgi:hypothetical protein
MMTNPISRRGALASLASAAALLLAGFAPQPSFQFSLPSSREGIVESIQTQPVQNLPGAALIGGALGSLIGGGTVRTVATAVGAFGGGFAGHHVASRSTTNVWVVGSARTTARSPTSGRPQRRAGASSSACASTRTGSRSCADEA